MHIAAAMPMLQRLCKRAQPGADVPVSTHTMIRWSALAACLTVAVMLGLYLVTGIGQDPLQYVHPAAEYQRILLADPPLLRLAIGLDNLFIAFYAAAFAGLAVH